MSLPPHFWPDLLRVAVFAAYALMSGQIVAIIFYYLKAHRAAVRSGAKGAGLLPLHVWLVSLTFWALASECAVFTYDHVGRPLVAWGVVNLVIFGASAVALWAILRFERRRVPEPAILLLHLRASEPDIPRRAGSKPVVMHQRADRDHERHLHRAS